MNEEEETNDGALVEVLGPGFFPTGPGGDGLTIRRDNQLKFRLWEVKKHAPKTGISGAVRRAMEQLRDRGIEYLAAYSLAGQYSADPDVARLFATLPDRWLDGDETAGAGVAVICSSAPQRCFSRFPHYLADLGDLDGRSGLAAGFSDFPEFTSRVRDLVWTGL